jgi:hypothetical protein
MTEVGANLFRRCQSSHVKAFLLNSRGKGQRVLLLVLLAEWESQWPGAIKVFRLGIDLLKN